MMRVGQSESDTIWDYYQNQGCEVFNLSYPRLRFIAKQCAPNTAVLNIGAGSGYLEEILTRQGVVVYSLDPNESAIKRLNEDVGLAGRARRGYSQNIPFQDRYFDSVIMTEVIEHIEENLLEIALREVVRVLKSGGRFIGTVPYREVLRDNEVFCPHCHKTFHRWGHVSSFDLSSLRSLLERNGLLVEKIQARTFPDFRRPGLMPFMRAIFRYVLGRMGEQLVGPNIYFVARRV